MCVRVLGTRVVCTKMACRWRRGADYSL